MAWKTLNYILCPRLKEPKQPLIIKGEGKGKRQKLQGAGEKGAEMGGNFGEKGQRLGKSLG